MGGKTDGRDNWSDCGNCWVNTIPRGRVMNDSDITPQCCVPLYQTKAGMPGGRCIYKKPFVWYGGSRQWGVKSQVAPGGQKRQLAIRLASIPQTTPPPLCPRILVILVTEYFNDKFLKKQELREATTHTGCSSSLVAR